MKTFLIILGVIVVIIGGCFLSFVRQPELVARIEFDRTNLYVFSSVDPVKEEAFVRMQAEEAIKRIPAGVDLFVNLFSQPPGQREQTVLFPDGSRFLLYRAKDKKLYSQKTDPQFSKQ